MKTLKILSALLCYPQADMQAALDEMADVLDREELLPERERRALRAFMQRLERTDLMELQERYVATFDRGRALSLHLFEHVHGQSRDRGQAMVNLLDVYRRHGFELDARELPDYIPLFLEYLAQRPMGEALDMLADAMHVVALIGARLAERGSDYHIVFDALAALVGEPADIEEIRHQAATEGPDQTVVNMDKIWEEEAVTFLANQEGCSAGRTGSREAQPVRWTPRPGSTQQPARSLWKTPLVLRKGVESGSSSKCYEVTIMSYLDTLLFGVYPYLAGAVFLLGSLARFDRDPFTWKAHSSQMLSNKNMRWASNLFHVGILLLFLGHFVGLLTPPEVFHALGVSAGAKQILAIVAGSVAGLMCFAGLTMLVQRRLNDPRVRANSTRMDIFILLLLYAQLILGLLTIPVSLMHLDGHNMLLLMQWARNVVTFDPAEAVTAITPIGVLFKLHIFLGLTVFLVFPFSRLVHIWSAPVTYPARPYQVVRQR